MATESWRWQGGIFGDATVTSANVGPSGSFVLAGYTDVNWSIVSSASREGIAVKFDAEGTPQWRWQSGTPGLIPNTAVAMGKDGSVVLAGTAQEEPNEFAAVKLGGDGSLLWEWQGGSTGEGTAHTVALAEDGSAILAGSTTGVWGEEGTSLGDFVAHKLDEDGKLVWTWQDGTQARDCISAAVVGEDESVVLAGYSTGNWSGSVKGGADFAAVKLDSDGNELWRWQSQTIGLDACTTAAMAPDGSIVLGGMSRGAWNGTHAGGYSDFAAVKLDANGNEIWRWQEATAGRDVFRDVVGADDGSVYLAGTTGEVWGTSIDISHDVTAVKFDLNGIEVWRWQSASAEAVSINPAAIAVEHNVLVVVAGWPEGSWRKETVGGYDVSAVMLEMGTSFAVPPSPRLVSGADSLTTPAQTPTDLQTTRTQTVAVARNAPRAVEAAVPRRSSVLTSTTQESQLASTTISPISGLPLDADELLIVAPIPTDPPTIPILNQRRAIVFTAAPNPPPAPAPTSPVPETRAPDVTISHTGPPLSADELSTQARFLTYSASTPTPIVRLGTFAPLPMHPIVATTAPIPTPAPTSTSVIPATRAPGVALERLPLGATRPAGVAISTLPRGAALVRDTTIAPASVPEPTPPPIERHLQVALATEAPSVTVSTVSVPESTPAPSETPLPVPVGATDAPFITDSPVSVSESTMAPSATSLPVPVGATDAPFITDSPVYVSDSTMAPSATSLPVPVGATDAPFITDSPVSVSESTMAPSATSLPVPVGATDAPFITDSPVYVSESTMAPSATSLPVPVGATDAPFITDSPVSVSDSTMAPSATSLPVPVGATDAPLIMDSPVSVSDSTMAPSAMPLPVSVGATDAPGVTVAPASVSPSHEDLIWTPEPLLTDQPTQTRLETTSPAPSLWQPTSPNPTSGSSFSPKQIGAVFAAATGAVIVAGLCLRKKRKAKKNGGNAGLPFYLRDSSQRRVHSVASGRGDRSAPSIDIPEGGPQPPPAVDINDVEMVDVLSVFSRAETKTVPPDSGVLLVVDPTESSGNEVAKAVMEAAHNLATQSHFPGVCEAAALVSILVSLVSDDAACLAEVESRVKRCRLVIMMLQRASTVLGKGDDINGDMERMLIQDVQTAVGDMVELIKTYRSKGRLSQVIVSTMFRRRMEETEAVIDRAISDLKLGLHVHAEVKQEEDRQSVLSRVQHDGTTDQLLAESIASTRRLRRQRNLNQMEIPEEHVTISKELLGKGGCGAVYIADYNGRNAAAKVMNIDVALCDLSVPPGNHSRRRLATKNTEASRQCTSFLLELQTMIRLRSPHTVNVYGAITSRKDRLVLVMELLTGGDLSSFLRHTEERLPEARARNLIGDVCAGMAFLHSKNVVHGDLKSPNILLDGEGRAKIADFGTSRWAQHGDTTGLATYKTSAGNIMQMMSFAWAAPEVLESKGSSYASDVYSFGIITWEVLSRKVPWADEVLPRDIYQRVVFQGVRPNIPADAPADIACIMRDCWAGPPKERPKSCEILGVLKARKSEG